MNDENIPKRDNAIPKLKIKLEDLPRLHVVDKEGNEYYLDEHKRGEFILRRLPL